MTRSCNLETLLVQCSARTYLASINLLITAYCFCHRIYRIYLVLIGTLFKAVKYLIHCPFDRDTSAPRPLVHCIVDLISLLSPSIHELVRRNGKLWRRARQGGDNSPKLFIACLQDAIYYIKLQCHFVCLSVCLSVCIPLLRHDRWTATKFGTHIRIDTGLTLTYKIDPPHPRGSITSYVTSSNVEHERRLKTTARRSMTSQMT